MKLQALPDIVHASIFSFLHTPGLLRAGEAGRWFRGNTRPAVEFMSLTRRREPQRSQGALTALLLSLNNLKTLETYGSQVTTGVLEALAEAFACGGGRGIQHLCLRDYELRLRAEDVRLVASILAAKSLPALRSLSLYLRTADDLGPLVSVLLSRRMDKLELCASFGALNAWAQALAPPLPPCAQGGFKEVELWFDHLPWPFHMQEEISVVLQSPLCARLETLSVWKDAHPLQVEEVDAIGEFLRDRGRTSLQNLRIGAWDSAITTDFVEIVAGGALTNLRSFSHWRGWGDDDDIANIMSAIVNAGGCPRLRELSISDDDGVCAVPIAGALAAGAFPALEKLDLHDWRHTDMDIATLARALRQPGVGDYLTHLDLSFDSILDRLEDLDDRYGDVGMLAVVSALEAGAMPHLQRLALRGAAASDQGITRLAGALKNKAGQNLRELDLTAIDAGERGVAAMVEALEAGACPTLEELSMGQYQARFDDEGRACAAGFMNTLRRSGAACVGTLKYFAV